MDSCSNFVRVLTGLELELANQGLRERLRLQEQRHQTAKQRLDAETSAADQIATEVAALKRQLKQRKSIAEATGTVVSGTAAEASSTVATRSCALCKRWFRAGADWERHSLSCV